MTTHLPLELDSFAANDYQQLAAQTAVYPTDTWALSPGITYAYVGLSGEVGEIGNKLKKIHRDKGGILSEDDRADLRGELGDAAWYLSQLATELGLELETIMRENIVKLQSRQVRQVLGGEGDDR